MANSKCPQCNSKNFELRQIVPAGASVKVVIVQCGSCGSVVGALDHINNAQRFDTIDKSLKLQQDWMVKNLEIMNENVLKAIKAIQLLKK